jgi:hypothetical protein
MLVWIFHELLSRDHEDGCATWHPQGVGFEAYLNGTSQGPTPEDARKDGHIRGRSKSFMKYPGWGLVVQKFCHESYIPDNNRTKKSPE